MNKLNKFLKTFKRSRSFNLDNYMGAVNLNLGCGNKPLKNFINIDYYNKNMADKLCDLNKPLPFGTETVDLIFSDNVFEHIENFVELINECYRILKKGGFLITRVPYFKSKHAFVDPTHLRFFTIQSMDYFVKDTFFHSMNPYLSCNTEFSGIYVFLDPENKNFFKNMIESYAVLKPSSFENSILSNIFVFHNIVYVIKK